MTEAQLAHLDIFKGEFATTAESHDKHSELRMMFMPEYKVHTRPISVTLARSLAGMSSG
jgi:hypothetical protein